MSRSVPVRTLTFLLICMTFNDYLSFYLSKKNKQNTYSSKKTVKNYIVTYMLINLYIQILLRLLP